MNTDVMFSHKSDEWETPQDLFDRLDAEFHFDLDVCATDDNHKCAKYYTLKQDGLSQEWHGTVWCNPPYSNIKEWAKACYEYGNAVMLVPSRTDTKWFHDYVYNKSEIRFIKGRLKFGDSNNSAPFPSMIVIFRKDKE